MWPDFCRFEHTYVESLSHSLFEARSEDYCESIILYPNVSICKYFILEEVWVSVSTSLALSLIPHIFFSTTFPNLTAFFKKMGSPVTVNYLFNFLKTMDFKFIPSPKIQLVQNKKIWLLYCCRRRHRKKGFARFVR